MKTKTETPSPPQFYVKIIRTHSEEVTRPRDPNDEWDNDDISHDHDIQGFSVVGEKEGWDFVLNENPEGDWQLVCAFYSTGDSFHNENNCLSLVSFVKHMEDAEAILAAIEKDYKAYYEKQDWKHEPLKAHLPIANKEEEIYTGTWKGYFERLQSVEIKTLGKTRKVTFAPRRYRR